MCLLLLIDSHCLLYLKTIAVVDDRQSILTIDMSYLCIYNTYILKRNVKQKQVFGMCMLSSWIFDTKKQPCHTQPSQKHTPTTSLRCWEGIRHTSTATLALNVHILRNGMLFHLVDSSCFCMCFFPWQKNHEFSLEIYTMFSSPSADDALPDKDDKGRRCRVSVSYMPRISVGRKLV